MLQLFVLLVNTACVFNMLISCRACATPSPYSSTRTNTNKQNHIHDKKQTVVVQHNSPISITLSTPPPLFLFLHLAYTCLPCLGSVQALIIPTMQLGISRCRLKNGPLSRHVSSIGRAKSSPLLTEAVSHNFCKHSLQSPQPTA